MNANEDAIVRAFIEPARRTRWLESLAIPKRRGRMLDRLNHRPDIDERYATELPSNTDIVKLLRAHGAPSVCYVLSCTDTIDGREFPLEEAIAETELGGWGTIISCIPGRLAYYYGECGERRMLLERSSPAR